MSKTLIDLSSLILVVVVSTCSWALSLLLAFSCWKSYKKSSSNNVLCHQCSSIQYDSCRIPPPQLLNHHLYGQGNYDQRPHTAERLGILESIQQPHTNHNPNSNVKSVQRSNSVFPNGSTGLSVLEVEHFPSPSEEHTDQDTTISRSFRSGSKMAVSVLHNQSSCSRMTLNKRFSQANPTKVISKEDLQYININEVDSIHNSFSPIATSSGETIQAKNSLVLKEEIINSKTKSKVSSNHSSSRNQVINNTERATNREEVKEEGADAVETSETILDTSDEVFTFERNSCNKSRREEKRKFKHIRHSSGRNWSNPKKERGIGSPGNTANADYFIKQQKQTPQIIRTIDLEEFSSQAVTEPVSKVTRRGSKSSWSEPQNGTRKDRSSVQDNRFLNANVHKAYKPGYSESDFTSQSEDESRRDAKGKLDLEQKVKDLVDARYEVTPPEFDLSNVPPDGDKYSTTSRAFQVTSALSTNPSPLKYSPVSFTETDMSLVLAASSDALPTAHIYGSSTSSHPVSLDWDNYTSDPQFQKEALHYNVENYI